MKKWISSLFAGAAIPAGTLALFLSVFAASAALGQPKAYVPNYNGHDISVIDAATRTVAATIVDPFGPLGLPSAAAVSPDGARAYVTNHGGQLAVIDGATDTVTSVINLTGGAGATAP